jgi:hypothetical protein
VTEKPKDANAQPETLAEMLFYAPDAAQRKQLEEYRIKYEATYGPTDLTKRYTSTWPTEQQDWLITHDSKAYFNGLPPFVKAYLKGKMQIAAGKGKLDDMPDHMLHLYCSGGMHLDCEPKGRGR